MRNLKALTIAILLAGTATTFNSCGGEKTEEVKKKTSGAEHVAELAQAIKDGKLSFEKTTSAELVKMFTITLDSTAKDSEDFLEDETAYDGYKLKRTFNLADGKIFSINYGTFVKGKGEKQTEEDGIKAVEQLKTILGKPSTEEEKNYAWTINNIDITLTIYTSGYDLYVGESYGDEGLDAAGADGDNCVGDYISLETELIGDIITNIKNGNIKIGSTTEAKMAELTGDGKSFNAEYDGLSVSGTFSYTGDKLTSISLNYFYNCEGAKSLLDLDKSDLATAITTALGSEPKKGGTDADASSTWKVGKQTVLQTNYPDGYSISVN